MSCLGDFGRAPFGVGSQPSCAFGIARLKQGVSPLFPKGWAEAHLMPKKHRAMIEKAFSQKQSTRSGG